MSDQPIPQNAFNLLIKVYAKTKKGSLKWTQTASPEMFISPLSPNLIIGIADTGYIEGMKNYCLTLIEGNQVILRISAAEHGHLKLQTDPASGMLNMLMGIPKAPPFISDVLKEIYENARQSALSIPQKIDKAIDLLDNITLIKSEPKVDKPGSGSAS